MPLSASHQETGAIDARCFGYTQLDVRRCQVVVREGAASVTVDILRAGTLHEWASRQTIRHEMRGRGTVYSVNLPTTPPIPVVIRRNCHGGLLRVITGEYFLAPTRAPYELTTSLRLIAAGVPTPEVIACAIYPAYGIFAKSDIMTRLLPAGGDVPAVWRTAGTTERDYILAAMGRLLNALAHAGARHADLNLKNIYITGSASAMTAYLLDVDRVSFPGDNSAPRLNFRRLTRSARKWRNRWGLDFTEDALAQLAGMTGEKHTCA